MIRTITSPHTKLYIPARIGAAGRRLMAVTRNELMRYVSFPDLDQAQEALDALRNLDLVHVVGGIPTRVMLRDVDRNLIVWETSVDAIMRMAGPANFGIDMCEFLAPNLVVLEAVYLSPRKGPQDDRRVLEDLLRL